MRPFIVVVAVFALAPRSPGQELPPAQDRNETAIRQAIFLNIYEARLSVESADRLLQTLGKLSPDLFPAPVRQRVLRDMGAIKVAKREWLSQHREEAQKWKEKEDNRLSRSQAQQSPMPYEAPLPAAFQMPGAEKGPIRAKEIQAEIDWINGRLTGVEYRKLILEDFIYHRLYDELQNKGADPRVKGAGENPDLSRQLLRWVIFQNLGAFAGDRAALERAMRQLEGVKIAPADRDAVLAELPRLITLRKVFLGKIIAEFEKGKGEVTIAIPKEVRIETRAGLLETQLRFDAKSKEELRYELETLGERPDAKVPDEALERSLSFIQAGYILSNLDRIRRSAHTPARPGVRPPG